MSLQIVLTILVLSSTIGAFRFKRFDKGTKIIALLTIFTAIVEVTSTIAAKRFNYNLIIYNIANPLGYVLVYYFFNTVIKQINGKGISKFFLIAALLCAALNGILIQNIYDVFNTYFLALESILVVGMAQYYFYSVLITDNNFSVLSPHFIIASLLLIYSSFSFFYWLLFYGFYESFGANNLNWFDSMNKSINLIMYAGFGLIFLFYHKFLTAIPNNDGN